MIFSAPKNSVLMKTVSVFLTLTFLLYNVSFAQPQADAAKAGDLPAAKSVITADDVGVAIDSGTIKSKHNGTSGSIVVHIQDAHCNYEAQNNINRMLDQLTKECGISMISVEGAEGVVDTTWFKAFPDSEIRKEVASYFMKKGEITGAEFFSITSDYSGTIFGAETRDYYVKNLKSFTEVYPYKDSIEKYFKDMLSVANRLKGIIYTPELKELDSKTSAFEAKEIELSAYADYLYTRAAKNGIDTSGYENFKKLINTLEYEKKIDFDIVDQERSNYIDALSKKLSKDQMAELVTMSLKFKKGHIRAAEFYSYLRDLAKTQEIPIVQDYPNLFYYYIYTKLYDGIDNEGLFKEIDAVEAGLKKKLFKGQDQQMLDTVSTMLDMYVDLVNIELTNEDYDVFQENVSKYSLDDIMAFLQKQCDKFGLNFSVGTVPAEIGENMPKMVDFYEIAMKRDNALIDNTLKQMQKEGTNRCVLIAGGFHTRGIKDILEKKNISYVVVTPKITKDVETPYIKVLTNQRTSLEDIITESAAMPMGITTSREEIVRAKHDMLAPLNRVFYTIPLAINDPQELRLLSEAIGAVDGRTIWDAANEQYRAMVRAVVRGWLLKVKAVADPAVWQDAVKNPLLILGAFLKKFEENARELSAKTGGVFIRPGFQVPDVVTNGTIQAVISAVSEEFLVIFQEALDEAKRETPGREAVRIDIKDGKNAYGSLAPAQSEGIDKVLEGFMGVLGVPDADNETLKKSLADGTVLITLMHVAAPKGTDPTPVKGDMEICVIDGFREAFEKYNSTVPAERQIPLDVKVHPGTGKGRWVRLYIDKRDAAALTREQLQRLANHEYYHILNPDKNESETIAAMGGDALADIREAFIRADKKKVDDTLREKVKVQSDNLRTLRSEVVAGNEGVSEVVAITNGGDSRIVEQNFTDMKSSIFRKDGNVRVMAHEEVTRRGQLLGLLDAMQNYREKYGDFNRDSVSLGIMMPGKGTRMSPYTQAEYGIKPFTLMLIRADKKSPWLNGATASLYSWNLVASVLKRLGFRGIAWKWGDEPQIASNSLMELAKRGVDMSSTDIVRFGSDVPVTDDLAENKEWLSADKNGNLTGWARRRPRTALLERLGVPNTPDARAMVHIGSPAFSYVLIEEASQVFKNVPKDKWLDVDGYFIEGLTYTKAMWDADYKNEMQKAVLGLLRKYYRKNDTIDPDKVARKIKLTPAEFRAVLAELAKDPAVVKEVTPGNYAAVCGECKPEMTEAQREALKFSEPGMHEVLSNVPNFYELCQELRERVNTRRGRPADAPLEIKVVDFGSELYWGDIGQLKKAREALYQVALNTPKGLLARELAAIDDIYPDEFGNLVVGDCVYPKDGSVRNSVLIDTKLYGDVKVNGAVIVESDIGNANIAPGAVAAQVTALSLTMGKDSFAYKSVVDVLDLKAEWAHTSMPRDPQNPAAGIESWLADMSKDVGSAEYYQKPQFGNPRSFAEQQDVMRQRKVAPQAIEKAISENFRQPMVERMKVMAERQRSIKPLGFGTSGIRGLVSRDELASVRADLDAARIDELIAKQGAMSDQECYINAMGFIKFLEEKDEIAKGDKIAIGGDLRMSTERIAAAVAQAVIDSGYTPDYVGSASSPALAYYAITNRMPSIMVTGSHIPEDRNGIKFTKKAGEVLKTDETPILSNVAKARAQVYGQLPEESPFDDNGMFKPEKKPVLPAHQEGLVMGMYVRRYLDALPADYLKGKTVVVYQHTSVARDTIVEILEGLGAKVIPVGYVKEGFVPVDTEKVSPDTIKVLKQAVIDHKPDFIISMDGDSDRPLFADEKGDFLTGDRLGGLVSLMLNPKSVAVPCTTNAGVLNALKDKGVKVTKTRVGSPYIVAKLEAGADVGWEANGGFLTGKPIQLPDWKAAMAALPTRDAALPLILAMRLAIERNQTASQLIETALPAWYGTGVAVTDRTPGCERYSVDTGKIIMKKLAPSVDIMEVSFRPGIVQIQYPDERWDTAPPILAKELTDLRDRMAFYFSPERGFSEIVGLETIDGVKVIFANGELVHVRASGNAPDFRLIPGAPTPQRDMELGATWKDIGPLVIQREGYTPGAQAVRTMPTPNTPQQAAVNAILQGAPLYVSPYREPKVWGVDGIGEYWYGAEAGNKSSIAAVDKSNIPMAEVMTYAPEEVLGPAVVRNFGEVMPLVKILTPKGRLSAQFHDAKNELWIVTKTAGETPSIILGFSEVAVKQYGDNVAAEYGRALEKYGVALNNLIDVLDRQGFQQDMARLGSAELAAAEAVKKNEFVNVALMDYDIQKSILDSFYNYRPVKAGDVIPIPAGTLHALGAGVEVVEPQIAGPTQSLEDGATYPVRYYFPGFERPGAQKKLDIDRVGEMNPTVAVEAAPEIIAKDAKTMIERLPGGFEDKGLEVHRITLAAGASVDIPADSFHTLVAIGGTAKAVVNGKEYSVPEADAANPMLVIPSTARSFKIVADTPVQIIDTFSPVPTARELSVFRGPKVPGTDEPVFDERLVFADFPTMTGTFDKLYVIDRMPKPEILRNRAHTILVQEGRIKVEKPDGTSFELSEGQKYSFPEGVLYDLVRMSDRIAVVKVDYEKTEDEKIVYATYEAVRRHMEQIQAGQVDLILPQQMFRPGGRNTVGSAQWEEEQLRRYVSDKIRIAVYDAHLGLKAASKLSVTPNAVAILVATESNIRNADKTDKTLNDFLFGKKSTVRVLAIPDIDKDKRVEENGWFFTREVEGTGLLLASVTPDVIATEGTGNAADDLQKLMVQLTGRSVPRRFLYYMLSYNEIDEAGKLLDEFREDPFKWLTFLVQNLLLKMPIKPFNATEQLEQRRKVMWSV